MCFAGSETLLLESGSPISMERVQVGDRIQVASATDGSLSFADVIHLPHRRNFHPSTFVELETFSGSIKATPSHLVISGTCGTKMKLTRAEDVVVGSCLASTSGEEMVIGSSNTQGQGVYSVVTSHPHGIIVVNGYKASSFALNHAVPNAYYNIHRMLHAYAPGLVQSLDGIGGFLALFVNTYASA